MTKEQVSFIEAVHEATKEINNITTKIKSGNFGENTLDNLLAQIQSGFDKINQANEKALNSKKNNLTMVFRR